MKTRNIAFTSALLISLTTAAFANTGTSGTSGANTSSTGGSSMGTPGSDMNQSSDSSFGNSAPADGTITGSGAPMGGTANDTSSTGFGSTGTTDMSSTNTNGTYSANNSMNSRQSVMDAQRSLVNQGFSISVDGRSGPQTQNAIRQFQARNGLPETGTLDSRTQEVLRSNSSTQPSASDTSAE